MLAHYSFVLEHTFGPTCTNSDVYEVIAPMVERCKIGYNATVLSYGPKSSGKLMQDLRMNSGLKL